MPRRTIHQFMWGFQSHLRSAAEITLENVFKALGIRLKPDVILVGIRRPDREDRHAVCIEPEVGVWTQELFGDILKRVEEIYANHRLQRVRYTDQQSNEDKPERMRRDSVRTAVLEVVESFADHKEVTPLCGGAVPVDNFYVVPVVLLPRYAFDAFDRVTLVSNTEEKKEYDVSLFHSVAKTILAALQVELFMPSPGRDTSLWHRRPEDFARQAASDLLREVVTNIRPGDSHSDYYTRISTISSLLYEGLKGRGHLIITDPDRSDIDWVVRFSSPVPIKQPRWVRKVLQISSQESALICDGDKIVGIGRFSKEHDGAKPDALEVEFIDRYNWRVSCAYYILLDSKFGEPSLPLDLLERSRFISNFKRLFPDSEMIASVTLWDIVATLRRQENGCMIVVAADAADEAERLERQGTKIVPSPLTSDLAARVSGIDGTVLVDPNLMCHAVGVILDGTAHPDCTPSRGSRYNSAVRYINSSRSRRLAVVLSADRTLDILPMLAPQISRDEMEGHVTMLERATLDNYHVPRNWLEEHRFYVTQDYCDRVNRALDRLEDEPREIGEILIMTERFVPDAEMNDSYFLPEDEPIEP